MAKIELDYDDHLAYAMKCGNDAIVSDMFVRTGRLLLMDLLFVPKPLSISNAQCRS